MCIKIIALLPLFLYISSLCPSLRALQNVLLSVTSCVTKPQRKWELVWEELVVSTWQYVHGGIIMCIYCHIFSFQSETPQLLSTNHKTNKQFWSPCLKYNGRVTWVTFSSIILVCFVFCFEVLYFRNFISKKLQMWRVHKGLTQAIKPSF